MTDTNEISYATGGPRFGDEHSAEIAMQQRAEARKRQRVPFEITAGHFFDIGTKHFTAGMEIKVSDLADGSDVAPYARMMELVQRGIVSQIDAATLRANLTGSVPFKVNPEQRQSVLTSDGIKVPGEEIRAEHVDGDENLVRLIALGLVIARDPNWKPSITATTTPRGAARKGASDAA